MLFMRNYNCLQQLFCINMRYLFFCITVFAALSNHSYLLAQNTCEAVASIPKKMGDDEFKLLVENIYELLLHENSVDEIVEMLDGDQTIPYNTKKLVTHINDLLNKQNSKGTVINIVVNNNGSKEYCSRANFLNLLTNATNYYFALKVIACILAFVVACILLSKWISGENGLFKGAPKPKNEPESKDNGKKSDEHELHNCDNEPQPFIIQEVQEPEIVKGMPLKVPQIIQIISEQITQGGSQEKASSVNKTNSEMVQREQAPSVTCIDRSSRDAEELDLDYELRGKTDQLIASLIDLYPEFVKPPHEDISVLAAEIPAVEQPIDMRSIRERIDEKISELKALL